METLNGYTIIGDWKVSPNGKFAFAQKGIKHYFIKEFFFPVWPLPGKNSPAVEERRKEECKKWESHQNNLMRKLQELAGEGGSLVVPVELFRRDAKYYKVSLEIDPATLTVDQISKLPPEKKLLLLKTLAQSIKTLHRANIVHGDLKPENILITRNESTGTFSTKTIDFDDSYFESNPPIPEETIGTVEYYSPELAYYILSEDQTRSNSVTCKSDVFAVGLIFHQFLTGKMPDFAKYNYAYEPLINGDSLIVDKKIRADIRELICEMLDADYTKRPTISEVFERLKTINLNEKPKIKDAKKEIRAEKDLFKRPNDVVGGPSMPKTPDKSRSEVKEVLKQANGQYKITYSDGKSRAVPEFYIKQNDFEKYLKD